MGKIANNIYAYASRYKYFIVVLFGVLIVGFLDDNSMLKRVEYEFEISDLREQVDFYTKQYEATRKHLKDIDRDPRLIERIAREKYFMKADDEDIFVLSDDQEANNFTNEASKEK